MTIDIEAPRDGGRAVALGAPPLPAQLPVLPLRDTVTFPDTLTPLAVGQERSVRLVNDVLAGDRQLVMVGSRDPDSESPAPDQLYEYGVVGTVARMLKVPDGTLRILVEGGQRVRIEEWVSETPYLVARISDAADIVERGGGADGADAQRPADVLAHHRGGPVPARRSSSSRSPTSTTPRRSRT